MVMIKLFAFTSSTKLKQPKEREKKKQNSESGKQSV